MAAAARDPTIERSLRLPSLKRFCFVKLATAIQPRSRVFIRSGTDTSDAMGTADGCVKKRPPRDPCSRSVECIA